MTAKKRLSASVDAELLDAVDDAVAHGAADNVSAWVSDALVLKLTRDRRLAALAAFVDAFEREHGVITPNEVRLATRRAHANAVVVRGRAEKARAPRQPSRLGRASR